MSASPRLPTGVLVVDANIVLGVVLGKRSRPVFQMVWAKRDLATSARAREEVLGRTRGLEARLPATTELVTDLLATIKIADLPEYASKVEAAALVLRRAPASRNGSTSDAHILALAWTLDADIWTHDRDFAGTGWPSWSSANLQATLAAT